MAQPNDANRPLISRRQLIRQGCTVSLGLGLVPYFPSEAAQTWSLSWLAKNVLASPAVDRPITVTIHFTAKSGKSEVLTHWLTQALTEARNAPGCRYAQVYVIADNPNQVVLFKGWDSRNAQDKYLKLEQSSGRLSQLLALVEGEPTVEYWEFQAT